MVTLRRYQLKQLRPVLRRRIVVGAVWSSRRAEIFTDIDEVDLLHPCVAVAPLAADQLHAGLGLEVDYRIRSTRQQFRRSWQSGRAGVHQCACTSLTT